MEKLVELSDQEILIDFSLNCKCRTNIHIKSLSSTTPLVFKIQTSSPHKFLVNPPTGIIIPPLSSTTFQIVLKPQPTLPPTYPRSPSDRFLLKSAIVDADSDLEINDVGQWFNSHPNHPTYDVKLKVYFVGQFLLNHAISTGDFESVKGIVKRQRLIVSQMPELGQFLLNHAINTGDVELVNGIVKRQPEIGQLGLNIEAVKGIVKRQRSDEILSGLMEAGLGVDGVEGVGWSELHVAAAFDRVEEVERLVVGGGVGVEVEGRDKEGRTPLCLAAMNGCLGSAKVLVSAGANVDARSKDGRTPLILAAGGGDRRMVEMLIEAGADPTVGGCGSAIDVARDKGHDIVKILERGEAVLHAARRGELDTLESLLEKGANMNFCDQYGLTPIHVAAIKGNKDVVMMLVEFGADVECQDGEGHTPLHLAVEGGNVETVEVLINREADVNAKSKKGATPLYISKLMEYEDVTQLLLVKGAVLL